MIFFKKVAIIFILFCSYNIFAGGNEIKLEQANTNINDIKSLQNGAKLFMNYCSGCHSISFMRYNRIGKDLGITEKQVAKNLMFNSNNVGDLITANVPEEAVKWFGNTPPDLSLTARARGVDWIYSYLNGFYLDDSRMLGVNNHVLKNASMPDVLWHLKSSITQSEFENQIRDITNFLDYVAEPVKLIRSAIGWWVMAFLSILLVVSYLLKKEYWLDVKYGKWKAKD